MGYEVKFDGDQRAAGTFAFGSAAQVAAFGEWARGLPAMFPLLRVLSRDGTVTDTTGVSVELSIAVEVAPPPDAIAGAVAQLVEVLGLGDESETMTIGQDLA